MISSASSEHVGHIVKHCNELGAVRVESSLEAERGWGETMRQLAVLNNFLLECTPGYYNQEGEPSSPNSLFSGQYGAGCLQFFEVLRQWRDEGSFAGLEIR
jgi:cyclohexanone monooxygenase